MRVGEKILMLRKSKNLSQEELADHLGVTRQTVSKWETQQSLPDFDKIIPICRLFGITADSFLEGDPLQVSKEDSFKEQTKRAFVTCISGFLYLLGLIWMILGAGTLHINYGILLSVFLLICGIATMVLVYNAAIRSERKKEVKEKDMFLDALLRLIALVFVILYLALSLITKAWDITWLIFIIFILVREIIRLIYSVRRKK